MANIVEKSLPENKTFNVDMEAQIYSTYTEFANKHGYPDAAHDIWDKEHEKTFYYNLAYALRESNGKVRIIFMGAHGTFHETIICIVETLGPTKARFIIDRNDLEEVMHCQT